MKKLLLFFILLSFSAKTKAQVVFCPPGAEWNSTFVWYIPYNLQNAKTTYTGDTLVNGETLKILSPAKFYTRQNCKYASRTLIRQKGDTIFMNNSKTQHNWQILYNYAAQAGHSWKITFLDAKNILSTYTISVDSVATVSINNFQLKRLYVKYWSNLVGGQPTTITERFGCDTYMFNYFTNQCSSDSDQLDKFLCYRDNDFGIKQLTDTACNFTDAVNINEYTAAGNSYKIYPNPVSDFLIVESEGSFDKIEAKLFDLQGRLVKTQILKEENKMDLRDLKAGMYFILISENGKVYSKSKFVKTN